MEDRPPSVDALARSLASTGLPHPVLVDIARTAIASGEPASASALASSFERGLLRGVVNATGVLLHTNLGRAPLGTSSAASYSNLEFDLTSGRRGSRSASAAALMARACGAESALIVNNGAAAVTLAMAAIAAGRDVVVSRGELVEIGGGFRIPSVIEASGARLVEVGTTNRTRLSDYTIGPSVAAILKVHASNYRITGFTESVSVEKLAGLGVPVIADIGSGLLDAACPWLPGGPPPWIAGEPAAVQTLREGAAAVTFSGDKLLGGPQAGIIAGRAAVVEACAAHPLARAFRPGGLVLAGLQDVTMAYLRRTVAVDVPFWAMATASEESLRARSAALGTPVRCASVTGGGTLPGVTIPSWGVAVSGDVSAQLRASEPPIVARVEDGRTVLDLRTVFPEQDEAVAKAVASL